MSSRNPCCSYRQNHHSKTLQTHSLPHTPSTEPAGETHPAAEQNTEKGKTEWKDKPAGHSQTDGGAGFSPCSEREAGERPKPPPRRRHSRAKHCPSDSASSKSYKPRDHPWMELIQPGPWAKLPPVPPPALPTHPASIPSLSQLWLRRWSSPFNPFEEKKEEDEGLKNDGMSWRSASQLADAASVNAKSATGMVKFPEMSRLDSDGVVDSQVSGLGSLSLNDSEASRLGDVSVADSELPKLGEDASSNVCEVSTNRYLSTKDGGISSGNSEDSKPDEGLTANSEVLCLVAAAVSSEDVCAATQTSSLLDSQLELCTLNERSSCLADSLSEAKPCSECSVADVSSVAEFSCVANVSQACSCPTVSGFPENASLPSVPNLAPETYDPAEAKLESAVVLQQSEIASSSHLAASERLKTNQAQQHSLPQSSPELASSNHKPCVTNSPTSSHLLANRVKASCLLPQTSSCEERSSSSSSSSSLQPPPPTETKQKSCKENPFNLKAPPVDSFSHRCTTAPSSTQTSAPGHGFPLIRRRVQADGYMLEEELQRQQGVLEDRLQELERQGQELEKKIHKCAPGKQEEELLVDWFTLIHEKHTLVRRDAELVHILKQQELEQKQADVEFQLRSLLNKPEREWTRDDEISEQKLTFELVAIIEQRDDIISSQEKDRQREQEKDDLLDAVIKKRDFYRHVKPQLLSFGGNLKPLRALKMLKALKARGSNRKEKRSSSISLS